LSSIASSNRHLYAHKSVEATGIMSFPNFDPSQGQNNQFTGDNNGTAGPGQPQQPQGMPQQQPGQNPEMAPPFQGQGMEQGPVGTAPPGGDSKTTLW
jgi:hypothetical protein